MLEQFCKMKKRRNTTKTATNIWLLLVLLILQNEVDSTNGILPAVKSPRFKRGTSGVGADSSAEDYGASFYGPDNPPTLLFGSQPQNNQQTSSAVAVDNAALTNGNQNSPTITTIDHQQPQGQHPAEQEPSALGYHANGHPHSHHIAAADPLQFLAGHSQPAAAMGATSRGRKKAEGNPDDKADKARRAQEEKLRRSQIKSEFKKLDQLVSRGEELTRAQTVLAACDRINELCQQLRQWKYRDAQMQKEQEIFYHNMGIIYHGLNALGISKEKIPVFNQPMLPALIPSDIDNFLSTDSVDLDQFRLMVSRGDDDDEEEKGLTPAKKAERRRHLLKALFDVLDTMIPLTWEMRGRKFKIEKITTAVIYIEKLVFLQRNHENAEQIYANLLEYFAEYMKAIKDMFDEKRAPMPLLSDELKLYEAYLPPSSPAVEGMQVDEEEMRKRKRAKAETYYNQNLQESGSGINPAGLQQRSEMTFPEEDHFQQFLMPSFGKSHIGGSSSAQQQKNSISSQHTEQLQQQHTMMKPMPGMGSAGSAGHGLHGQWSDAAGVDDVEMMDNATLFKVMRDLSAEDSNTTEEELKKTVREHKIKETQLEAIICHQKALMEEQNELSGVVANHLMEKISKLTKILHENGFQSSGCDHLPTIVDPLPGDRKRKFPMLETDHPQQLPVDQAVNLADLALRVTLLQTLSDPKEREKFIIVKELLMTDQFDGKLFQQLDCFLLFKSRPILQLIPTEVRQRINVFKPMRTKTAKMLAVLVEKAEKEIGHLRDEMSKFNSGGLNHIESMWNLRFYEHIYKAILARLPTPFTAEINATTTNEGIMLANARKLLAMAIEHIEKDLDIFGNPDYMAEKLAQKRDQCDIK